MFMVYVGVNLPTKRIEASSVVMHIVISLYVCGWPTHESPIS